jgi:hypothetical protein
MATDNPGSLSELVLGPDAPREIQFAAARGVLPVTPVELVGVLISLSGIENDEELARTAKQTLAATDSAVIAAWVFESSDSRRIDRLARQVEDSLVIESILRSRQTEDETLVWLAERLHPDLQEVLAVNQARLLHEPRILEALRANPRLTGDVRRRLHEIDEEFFKKGPVPAAGRPTQEAAPGESGRSILEKLGDFAKEQESSKDEPGGIGVAPGENLFEEFSLPEELIGEDVPLDDEKRKTLFQLVVTMGVSQKIQLAHKGNKEARSLLIRDSNKLVSAAAVASPRITPNEIEQFAAMRSVSDEVLRHIASHRDYSRRYPVVLNLVRNPKLPVELAVPLIPRLTQKDLKSLTQDKGISEIVRVSARRLYQVKFQK